MQSSRDPDSIGCLVACGVASPPACAERHARSWHPPRSSAESRCRLQESLNLASKTYLRERNLKRVVTSYIDKVAGFNGARWGGEVIVRRDITERVRHLAVPHSANEMQSRMLDTLAKYAQDHGVKMIVEVVR
ncbi:hypothetical protein [Microbacterium luticocti]|uniref:endonuclease toxin domain-containing protein n=1 Tax=Microbacterium luticocti TaxID=451764 RepID=UPI003CCC1A5D